MATQLLVQRNLALQHQGLLAAPRTGMSINSANSERSANSTPGNVSITAYAITLLVGFMEDTAVLTRTGTHLAAPPISVLTT